MEYCSVCRTARNMRISSHKEKKIYYSKGKGKDIIIKTFHCEHCGSFVRSEIVDNSAALSELTEKDKDIGNLLLKADDLILKIKK